MPLYRTFSAVLFLLNFGDFNPEKLSRNVLFATTLPSLSTSSTPCGAMLSPAARRSFAFTSGVFA